MAEFVYGYSAVVITIMVGATLVFVGALFGTKKTAGGPHHVDNAAGDEGED